MEDPPDFFSKEELDTVISAAKKGLKKSVNNNNDAVICKRVLTKLGNQKLTVIEWNKVLLEAELIFHKEKWLSIDPAYDFAISKEKSNEMALLRPRIRRAQI